MIKYACGPGPGSAQRPFSRGPKGFDSGSRLWLPRCFHQTIHVGSILLPPNLHRCRSLSVGEDSHKVIGLAVSSISTDDAASDRHVLRIEQEGHAGSPAVQLQLEHRRQPGELPLPRAGHETVADRAECRSDGESEENPSVTAAHPSPTCVRCPSWCRPRLSSWSGRLRPRAPTSSCCRSSSRRLTSARQAHRACDRPPSPSWPLRSTRSCCSLPPLSLPNMPEAGRDEKERQWSASSRTSSIDVPPLQLMRAALPCCCCFCCSGAEAGVLQPRKACGGQPPDPALCGPGWGAGRGAAQ